MGSDSEWKWRVMNVSVTVKLINMQMHHILQCIILMEVRCFSRMYEQLTIPICLSASATVSDFHVKRFQSAGKDEDLMIYEELSFLKSCDWLKSDTLKYYSEKMFQACSPMRGGVDIQNDHQCDGGTGVFCRVADS